MDILLKKLALLLSLFIFCSVGVAGTKNNCDVIFQKNITTLPLADIKDYIQMFIYEQSGVPGLMIGIVDDQQEVQFSCGEIEKDSGKRPDRQTVWPIGSISKVLTTHILAKMVNNNEVNLTTPIKNFLPSSVKVPSFKSREITLLDLATHSSGFPRMLPTLPKNDDYQVNDHYDEKTFYDWLSHYQLKDQPGKHYEYSNIGFGLLGNILSGINHMSYGTLLTTYISKPLEMSDTTVTLSDDQKKREVKTYWLNGDLIKNDWIFTFEQASGGIYSTANDMMKFLQYELNLPSNMNSESNTMISHAAYIFQDQFNNPMAINSDAIALGWDIDFNSQGLPSILRKSGWVDGANCYIDLVPNKKIGIISFTNKPYTNISADFRRIIAMILMKEK